MLIKYINNKIIKISVKNANTPLQLRETLVYPIGEMEWFGLKVQPIDIDGFIELKILVLPVKNAYLLCSDDMPNGSTFIILYYITPRILHCSSRFMTLIQWKSLTDCQFLILCEHSKNLKF